MLLPTSTYYLLGMVWLCRSRGISLDVLSRSYSQAMKFSATNNAPFSTQEMERTLTSLQNLTPEDSHIDWSSMQQYLIHSAHKSYKNWTSTERAAETLVTLLSKPQLDPFKSIFRRVLKDGNWAHSVDYTRSVSSQEPLHKPWITLITGVNGIRKTTSTQQAWFSKAISQSINAKHDYYPSGQNSFFRQLDYIVATIANEEFKSLYKLTAMEEYTERKDAIFARYRTLAEIVGVLLIKAAREEKVNVMVETSGRDIAMFEYVDYFFPDDEYRKLVVHFTINDLKYAEKSVDSRMCSEMLKGVAALSGSSSIK